MLSACVRAEPFPVRVGTLNFLMPAYHADRWLIAVSSEVVRGVIPGLMLPEDAAQVIDGLMVGDITYQDLERAALDAISEASGRPWWEAVRLAGWADQKTGEMYGHLILNGVHPDRVTFAAWCAAMFAFVMKGREQKDRQKIEFDLMIPPPMAEDEMVDWDTGVPAGFSAELPAGTA